MTQNGIAIIGAGMIGGAHAYGYATHRGRLSQRLPDLNLHTVCDMDQDLAQGLADMWGFANTSNDWKVVLADPAISIVSVCLPNFLHAEVTAAAIAAGKHVICEKPLATSADDARKLWALAREAKVTTASVSNYRRIPAVAEIRKRVAAGEIGNVCHALVQYQAEYAADPQLPYSWRYDRSRAGAGALLDLGPHALDAAQYICGDIVEVAGATETIAIPQRYLPKSATTGHGKVELSDEIRVVDNDDIVSALLRFRDGASGMFSVSRVMTGMGNTLSLVISGTGGTIRFTSERAGEFQIATRDRGGMFETVINRPASPFADLMPVPHDGVAVGYAESFSYMIYEFLDCVAERRPMQNGSIEDGAKVVVTLDAIGQSIATKSSIAVSL